MSWTCIALYLHDTIFNRGRFNGFVSKKEDDAGELISRAEFIYKHIPEHLLPHALLPQLKNGKMSQSPPIMEFVDTNSKLQGFPMGADQLRQFTLSGLLGDECAFWPEAQKFYSSTKPTTEGGGRMTLISSRSPGFFKKIVFDRLDALDLNFPERPPTPPKHPIPGIEVWKNPTNGFLVYDCHYMAHPKKRDPAWVQAVRGSMPIRDFLMEYEKSWQTYEGKPVYGDFNKPYHVSTAPLEPEPGIPLLLGWDFGLTPACILAQLVDNQLRIIKEYIGSNEGIKTFAPRVWQDLKVNFPNWSHRESDLVMNFIDPAGLGKSQVDEVTCAQEMSRTFSRIFPGPVDFEARKQAVEEFLIRNTRKGAALLIDETGCPTLIEGFAGGYQYNESTQEIQPDRARPLKNRYSHPHDALQYLCDGAAGKMRHYNFHDEDPSYGFLKRAK